MASLTNQTDSYSKEEVATLVANKADGAAFTTVKNQIDNPLTGMVALNNSLEAKADAVYTTTLNTALGVVRNTVNDATTGVAALNTAMGNKADAAAFTTVKNTVNDATTGVAALNTAMGNKADGAAFTTVKNTVNDATTGVAALNTALTTLTTTVTTNKTALDARATDNLANINTTLVTPNPYPSFGTFVFPIDIPAFTQLRGSWTTGTSYPVANAGISIGNTKVPNDG